MLSKISCSLTNTALFLKSAGNCTKTSPSAVDALLFFCYGEYQNLLASPHTTCDPIGQYDHA